MDWQDLIIGALAASIRIGAAVVATPVFSTELMPPLVRNGVIAALALSVAAAQPFAPPEVFSPAMLLLLFFELGIGLGFGLVFASMLYAFEAAGQMIDAKIGATSAQLQQPYSGAATSLFGQLYSQLSYAVFASLGGFLLFFALLLESFTLAPLGRPGLRLAETAAALYAGEFSSMFAIALAVAAPALVLLFLLEFALGIANRVAPQLNAFAFSLALKAWISSAILAAGLFSLAQVMADDLPQRAERARTAVQLLWTMESAP